MRSHKIHYMDLFICDFKMLFETLAWATQNIFYCFLVLLSYGNFLLNIWNGKYEHIRKYDNKNLFFFFDGFVSFMFFNNFSSLRKKKETQNFVNTLSLYTGAAFPTKEYC